MRSPRTAYVPCVLAAFALMVTAGCGATDNDANADGDTSSATTVDAPTSEEVCAAPPAPDPLEDQASITVAMPVRVQNFDHILLADALGELEKENVDVSVEIVQTPDIVTLLAQGRVDIGAIGLSAGVLNAIAEGLQFKWVSGFTKVLPTDDAGLYVRSDWVDDASDFDMGDLVGKRIAIGAGGLSTQQVLDVKLALAEDDVAIDDVEIVELNTADFGSALQSRAVDAVVGSNVQQILDQQSGVKVSGIAPITAGGYFFGESLLTDQREVGLAVMRAMVRTQCEALTGDYYENPGVLDALVEVLEIPEDSVLQQSPQTFDLKIADGSLEQLESAWREQDDLLQYSGEVDRADVVDETLYAEMVE